MKAITQSLSVANGDSVCLAPKNLPDLPHEILQDVASLLPLSSKSALVLSCRKIMNILGTQSFEDLKIKHLRQSSDHTIKERLDFLFLLEKDFPNLIVCFECYKLHDPFVGLNLLRREDDWTPGFCAHRGKWPYGLRSRMRSRGHGYGTLKTPWAQLALKHHRLGRDTRQLLDRATGRHQDRHRDEGDTHSTAIIITVDTSTGPEDRLYLRTAQDALILTSGSTVPLREYIAYWELAFCSHQNTRTDAIKLIERLAGSYLNRNPRIPAIESVAKLERCPLCPTEYEIKLITECGHAVLLPTIYQDFGPVNDLRDPLWTSHFEITPPRQPEDRLESEVEEHGILRARFEAAWSDQPSRRDWMSLNSRPCFDPVQYRLSEGQYADLFRLAYSNSSSRS